MEFYAISMCNNEGTVIVASNDSGSKPLAYFQDENDLDLQQVLADSVSDLAFIIRSVIAENEVKPISQVSANYEIGERLAPKCKVSWTQNSPYNKYCFTKDGKQALAGSVAVAGAQALTVLRPHISFVSSWEDIIKPFPSSKAADEIARLVSYVGQKTGMDYGDDFSVTEAAKLIGFFTQYNINCYGQNNVIDVLKTQHGIVVASGYSTRHGWGTAKDYLYGHTFVADGYIKYNNMKDPYYLHLNYGMGKFYNKNVYVLSANKNWDLDLANKTYGKAYPYRLMFYTFCYPSEKNWK